MIGLAFGCAETDIPEPTPGAVARRTISRAYGDFAFAYALPSSWCSASAFFRPSYRRAGQALDENEHIEDRFATIPGIAVDPLPVRGHPLNEAKDRVRGGVTPCAANEVRCVMCETAATAPPSPCGRREGYYLPFATGGR